MDRLGSYRIIRKLGEGGMGVVWAAQDERLGRIVALKTLRETAEPNARERLWREARAAASINHPNVCSIYEVGEADGELFVAMEMLEGEALAERLDRGPLPAAEAVSVGLSVLRALSSLHAQNLIHRDLKPSNVFLTPQGVKLLDFGLALPLGNGGAGSDPRLTTPGMMVGTPRYMAPEQWSGAPVGPASDIFAAGALLFEMLTGRPAFAGETPVALYHAIAYEQPPALAGGPAVQALDRVLQRALAKRPAQRYPQAQEMADDLASAVRGNDATQILAVRAVTRLIVLPFRMQRADAELDFLALGLADAITASLSGLESLVVRAPRAAARFGPEPDLAALASALEVDAILLGTILAASGRVRLSTQLVEAASGTILWSHTAQAPADDVFALEDQLARGVVEGLALPLSSRERSLLRADVPGSARAYELYLRGTHMGTSTVSTSALATARDLFKSCLEEDPRFAPAWARLGRVYRVMAKYGHDVDTAECARLAGEAFARALELNPDLPLAHNYFTYYEIEELGQAPRALTRLLGRVRGGAADAELYEGLVVACRFCGLLEASVAADERAKRLDPTRRSSVHYTHWMRGDYEKAMAADSDDVPFIRSAALMLLGRVEEGVAILRDADRRGVQGAEYDTLVATHAALGGRPEDAVAAADRLTASRFRDQEGIYLMARVVAHAGAPERAMEMFRTIVGANFSCPQVLRSDPWLAGLSGREDFQALIASAEEHRARAVQLFDEAGGSELLGVDEP